MTKLEHADDHMRRVVKAKEAFGWWTFVLACGHTKMGHRCAYTTYNVRKPPPMRVFCRVCAGVEVPVADGKGR